MLNDFYTVQDFETADGRLSCVVGFNAGHAIFEGHFPGSPIVPGVCTMHMVGELLHQATGKTLRLSEASGIKYLRLIMPEATPAVSVSWSETDGFYTVSAALKDGTQMLFKMTGRYLLQEAG